MSRYHVASLAEHLCLIEAQDQAYLDPSIVPSTMTNFQEQLGQLSNDNLPATPKTGSRKQWVRWHTPARVDLPVGCM